MKVLLNQYIDNQWKKNLAPEGFDPQKAQLVLAFGHPALVINPGLFAHMRALFPTPLLCPPLRPVRSSGRTYMTIAL